MKRLTTEEFIAKARAIHGDKYDYSKVEYTNNRTKVCIICPEHGEFWQSPDSHLQGCGCKSCSNDRLAILRLNEAKAKRPDLSHIETPKGSKAVPVGTKGDYALVDDEDYERVMQYNWCLSFYGYAINDGVGKMHRFIMNPPDDKVIDHINHNKLDNRKSQLRVCTHQQNSFNSRLRPNSTSKYKGVSRDKIPGKWRAYLTINYKYKHLGTFDSEELAAEAYNRASKRYFNDFVNINLL